MDNSMSLYLSIKDADGTEILKKDYRQWRFSVPRIGDQIAYTINKYATVTEVVWCLDRTFVLVKCVS